MISASIWSLTDLCERSLVPEAKGLHHLREVTEDGEKMTLFHPPAGPQTLMRVREVHAVEARRPDVVLAVACRVSLHVRL